MLITTRRLAFVFVSVGALGAVGCAPEPIARPASPISAGAGAPEDIRDEAEDLDRMCSGKEAQLVFSYQEGKEEQEEFKTIIGSITGGVGTAGGIAAGVGGIVADPDDVETITAVSGFITAGLGAIGGIVGGVVTPGKEKMETSQASMAGVQAKKENARKLLAKSGEWTDEDRAAWAKAKAELEEACKPLPATAELKE